MEETTITSKHIWAVFWIAALLYAATIYLIDKWRR
jgi:hypothetical protein